MVITILCGARPELLEASLSSLFKYMPQLHNETIIALHNGSDAPTGAILEMYNIPSIKTPKILPIGEAISLLAKEATKSGEKYWLSMEDDFICTGAGIDNAVKILDSHPRISQVRLRREDDGGLNYHMVTRKPLHWFNKPGFKYGEAHRTFNNNLTRTADATKCFPCTGERDAQKQWHTNGMKWVAQLKPGFFKHIGDDNSLRKITECET